MKIVPEIITNITMAHKNGAVTIHYDGDGEFVIMDPKDVAQRILNLCEGHELEREVSRS